jgi:choline dehydrogenase-like flavoprotein
VLGIRAVDGNGQALEAKARSVVLACGAVENARLLMLSRASRSKWLGCCFMEHARDFSLVLVPDSPRLFADASFYDVQKLGDTWTGGRLCLSDAALDAYRLPNASMTLTPRVRSRIGGGGLLGRMLRQFRRPAGDGWQDSRYGWSKVRAPEEAFDAFRIILNLEQRPNPNNRIELSARTDRFGNPLPRLVLDWTDEEQAGLNRLRDLLGEWFRSARLGRLIAHHDARPDLNAHHHAGTTRMGVSQEDGVVDSEGQVFGLDNLYVAGASVFPSAGFANPTLTIVALARRLARHIGASLG